jgi:dihydropteroate synthase
MNASEFRAWLHDPARRPLVMGVLNVTPDSFSDGNRFLDPSLALEHALEMEAEGADMIDVGGESTRPGALPVPPDEQIRRVLPAIRKIRQKSRILISMDTTSSQVAAAALDEGADWVNDISAGTDDERMLPLIARRRVPVCLMHMQGRPGTMQRAPHYEDVTGEVAGFLNERITIAGIHGIEPGMVVVDPGIGFGKTVDHNLELLRRLRELTVLGAPLLVGVSRKSFIGRILDLDDPAERCWGTAAAVAWCAANGASIHRVHDVGPMGQVVRVIREISSAPSPLPPV